MKNPTMIIVIIAVVAVFGIGEIALFQQSSQSDSTMNKDEVMTPKEDTAVKTTDAMMKKDEPSMEKSDDKMMGDTMTSSRYVEFTKASLDTASSNRRVLFFYASWCSTCRPTDANFKASQSKIPEEVTVIRVNFNDPETDQDEKDLAKKYGITYQHTFVQVDGAGKEVAKWNGGQLDELLTNIK